MEMFIYVFCFLALAMVFLMAFISLAIYFIPVIIAYVRRHNNFLAICLLTIFTGWTFLGWLAALLWSLNSDVERDYEDSDDNER